jgi:hypothetical protein
LGRTPLGRNRWLHDERYAEDPCDRRDIADEIEAEFIIRRRVDRILGIDHEEGIAVGRRTNGRFCANIAASARAILDDELLGQMVRFPGDSPGDRDTFPYSASPETGATAAE